MAAQIEIKQGLDIPMVGAPGESLRKLPDVSRISIYPSEYSGRKFRLLVREGDRVKRGGALAFTKKQESVKITSPAAGVVEKIRLGERRSLQEIVIAVEGDEAEVFPRFTAESVRTAERSALLDLLCATGYIRLIRQRPFSGYADPTVSPKSIFVNAMNTAPFRPDAHVLVKGKENEFQTGLNALTRLTDGPVYLCADAAKAGAQDAISQARNVNLQTFSGPHPSGNTSTHIHALDPISPGDQVWTLRVSDVIRIGELLVSGEVQSRVTVVLAGNGVKESARGYATVQIGAPLSGLLDGVLEEGEQRVVRGDLLSGDQAAAQEGVFFGDQGFVVIPEDRERHLLGWLLPTTRQFSDHRVVASKWVQKTRRFVMGTNTRGGHRAMVLTGIMDKYVPLNIMVDYLTRACLARDTTEAVALGILETDPEDFALCTVVCPSKTDYGRIIADGLALIEQEGI